MTKLIAFKILPEQDEKLRQFVKSHGDCSVSCVIRQALEEFLKDK